MAITDQALAARLLSAALGGEPVLSAEQMADLLQMAEVTVIVGETPQIQFTDDSLRRSAVVGWGWKAALTADKYEIGGGPGRALSEQQWFDHCAAMAARFSNGQLSVTAGGVVNTRRPRGIRSIGMVSSAAVEAETWPPYVVNQPEGDS